MQNTPKAAYGSIKLTQFAPLFENLSNLSTPVFAAYPQTMEQLDQDFGYLLYSTEFTGPCEAMDLILTQLHDRAHIFVNGKLMGIRERTRRNDEVKICAGHGETLKIDILVENMGRINYGPLMFNKKGFICVNGFNIGRYYNEAGPQLTLYVPSPILKEGQNEIVLFETDGFDDAIVAFVDTSELSKTQDEQKPLRYWG